MGEAPPILSPPLTGDPLSPIWTIPEVTNLLLMTAAGRHSIQIYLSNTNTSTVLVYTALLPNWGLTVHPGPGVPTRTVYINISQSMIDAAATFVHEMQHVALPGRGEFAAYQAEIIYYTEMSNRYNYNFIPVQYRAPAAPIVRFSSPNGQWVIDEARLTAYINTLGGGAGGAPPIIVAPWPAPPPVGPF